MKKRGMMIGEWALELLDHRRWLWVAGVWAFQSFWPWMIESAMRLVLVFLLHDVEAIFFCVIVLFASHTVHMER